MVDQGGQSVCDEPWPVRPARSPSGVLTASSPGSQTDSEGNPEFSLARQKERKDIIYVHVSKSKLKTVRPLIKIITFHF